MHTIDIVVEMFMDKYDRLDYKTLSTSGIDDPSQKEKIKKIVSSVPMLLEEIKRLEDKLRNKNQEIENLRWDIDGLNDTIDDLRDGMNDRE